VSTHHHAAPRHPRPSVGRIAGELLLTVGVVLLLFVIYELFWTNITSARLQQEATAGLEEQWASRPPSDVGDEPVPPPAPEPGQPFARLHLPTLGQDAQYTVIEGTGEEDLRTGPGHYPDTQLPGERGNLALAGHRNGSGAVFQHIDRLRSCDAVVVETETQWLTYRVLPFSEQSQQRRDEAADCLPPELVQRIAVGDYSHVPGQHITTPDAIEVISPMPGAPWPDDDEPDTPAVDGHAAAGSSYPMLERLVTLTTCHPQFSNTERLIVHGVLAETTPKADGQLPDALKE